MDGQEILSYAAEALNYSPFLDYTVRDLAGSLGGFCATWCAWKALSWPFRRYRRARAEALVGELKTLVESEVSAPDAVPEAEKKARYSPAAEVVLRALAECNPSYNPATMRLFLPGVAVEFSGSSVRRIVGNPRVEADKVLGTEVLALLRGEEVTAVCSACLAVRQAILERDLRRANERAADEMTAAHYREKARRSADALNGHHPVYVNDTVLVPDDKKLSWLNEPSGACPPANPNSK